MGIPFGEACSDIVVRLKAIVQELQQSLPLLPDQVRDKLEKKYDLTTREVDILVRMSGQPDVTSISGLAFFEAVASSRKARIAANWCVFCTLFARKSTLI